MVSGEIINTRHVTSVLSVKFRTQNKQYNTGKHNYVLNLSRRVAGQCFIIHRVSRSLSNDCYSPSPITTTAKWSGKPNRIHDQTSNRSMNTTTHDIMKIISIKCNGSAPVSYTHLDVYKRQLYDSR